WRIPNNPAEWQCWRRRECVQPALPDRSPHHLWAWPCSLQIAAHFGPGDPPTQAADTPYLHCTAHPRADSDLGLQTAIAGGSGLHVREALLLQMRQLRNT